MNKTIRSFKKWYSINFSLNVISTISILYGNRKEPSATWEQQWKLLQQLWKFCVFLFSSSLCIFLETCKYWSQLFWHFPSHNSHPQPKFPISSFSTELPRGIWAPTYTLWVGGHPPPPPPLRLGVCIWMLYEKCNTQLRGVGGLCGRWMAETRASAQVSDLFTTNVQICEYETKRSILIDFPSHA